MSEWVKCSDRMPEYGERVLVWDYTEPTFAALYRANEYSEFPRLRVAHFTTDAGEPCIDVTHWMAPPEQPKDDE